jgi:trimeric autotransporter adhesin
MKKLYAISLFTFTFSLFTHLCEAQSVTPLGTGVNEDVECLAVYNNKLYAGGNFDTAGGLRATLLAQWSNNVWDTIPGYSTTFREISSSSNDYIAALCVYDSDLYIAGRQGNNAQGAMLEWWNDTLVYSTVYLNGPVSYALCVYDSSIYVGGWFSYANSVLANDVVAWDGTAFTAQANGIVNSWGITVNALAVYNDSLYAGGDFGSAGNDLTAKSIAVWNGASWYHVGGGLQEATVNCLIVYNNTLIAAGLIDSAGGNRVKNIASWNGSSWQSLGVGVNGEIYSMAIYHGELFVGGQFDSAGGQSATSLAMWDGLSWHSVVNGFTSYVSQTKYLPSVLALAVYDSSLIVGGYFDSVNGININNIFKLNTSLGINTIKNNTQLAIYPNPSNGKFTFQIKSEELSEKNIEIYNVLGEQVYNSQLSTFNTQFTLDLSSNPSGVYLYRVITDSRELVGEGKLVLGK